MASVKIPEQKVILVGDFGVGKSSLFRRFMNDTFVASTDRKATLGQHLMREIFIGSKKFMIFAGLDHYSKTFHVNNKALNIQLFDTGGKWPQAS